MGEEWAFLFVDSEYSVGGIVSDGGGLLFGSVEV